MSKRKIGVTFTGINEERLEKIKAIAKNFEIVTSDKDDLSLADCEIIFGHASKELLAAAHSLKWLHCQFAGVDIYLKPEMQFREDIILTNSTGAYGIAISEHLLTLTLGLMRRMMEYGRFQAKKEWSQGHLAPSETIYGSTVAVVGLGNIGSNFAARCKALGASVIGVVRTSRNEIPPCVDAVFTVDKLDEAIKGADVVALCLPGTDETAALFDARRLSVMKKGAYILNVGRGNAIDTDALTAGIKSGHIGGAGLDVTHPEPLPKDHELWELAPVIITPHVSARGMDMAQDLIMDKFLRYLEDYIEGKPLEKVVDRTAGY